MNLAGSDQERNCNLQLILVENWAIYKRESGGTVYTADSKSAARSGLRVRIPPLLPDIMRAILNFEKSHLEVLLRLLSETEEIRLLNPSEQYVRMILQEALDNIDKGM